MQITPAFELRLRGFDLAALDRDSTVICGITARGVIEYVNDAWWAFARANGAGWSAGEWGLGANVLAATPEPLRFFYEGLYARTLTSASPVVHFYECSSADTKRQFGMRLYPLANDCLLIAHALLAEATHGDEASPVVEHRYRQPRGSVVQCAHCRRVQRVGEVVSWDWVPALVSQPRWPVSHGLCPSCFAHHYRQPPEVPTAPFPRRSG